MKRSPLLNFVALVLFFGALLALQLMLSKKTADAPTLVASDEIVPPPPQTALPQVKSEPQKEEAPMLVVKKRSRKPREREPAPANERAAVELDTEEARHAYILQNNIGTPSARAAPDVYIPFENFTRDSVAHK